MTQQAPQGPPSLPPAAQTAPPSSYLDQNPDAWRYGPIYNQMLAHAGEPNMTYNPDWVAMHPEFQTNWQQTYWNSPSRLQRWYNVVNYAPPGVTMPPWIDKGAISAAYNYMAYVNGGFDTSTWKPLEKDDPGRSIFDVMAVPPASYQMTSDQMAMDSSAAQGGQPVWDFIHQAFSLDPMAQAQARR